MDDVKWWKFWSPAESGGVGGAIAATLACLLIWAAVEIGLRAGGA